MDENYYCEIWIPVKESKLSHNFQFINLIDAPRGTKAHFYTLHSGVACVCGATFSVSRRNCLTENVASLVPSRWPHTLAPAKAAIPLWTCRDQTVLTNRFAANKFERIRKKSFV